MKLGDLHTMRIEAVYRQLLQEGASKVLDLGCGKGPLFLKLAEDERFKRLVGVEISLDRVRMLRERLSTARLWDSERMSLLHDSFTEPHERLVGFDAAVLLETVEHISPRQLPLLEQTIFQIYQPATVIVTTPNVEFNDLLGVPRSRFRHPEHFFEWTREQFAGWARKLAAKAGYETSFKDVGASHPRLGGPTQMAVFRRG